jgi:hypothetical protein
MEFWWGVDNEVCSSWTWGPPASRGMFHRFSFFVANESCISFFGGKQNVQTKPAMIWRVPEIVVPPNHPFYCNGIFHCKASSYWGTPMTMETFKKCWFYIQIPTDIPLVSYPCLAQSFTLTLFGFCPSMGIHSQFQWGIWWTSGSSGTNPFWWLNQKKILLIETFKSTPFLC